MKKIIILLVMVSFFVCGCGTKTVEKEKELLLCREHRKLAREMAAKSFFLLKNEELLPLKKENGGTIALLGPYADTVEMFGAWSFPKKPEPKFKYTVRSAGNSVR